MSIITNLRWGGDSLFQQARFAATPVATIGTKGLLSARVGIAGRDEVCEVGCRSGDGSSESLSVQLRHELNEPKGLLTGIFQVSNTSDEEVTVDLEFLSSARCSPAASLQEVHLPLTINGSFVHPALEGLGNEQLVECRRHVGPMDCFAAHYLEPLATEEEAYETKAQLFIPLLTLLEQGNPLCVSLFASPERPWRVAHHGEHRGESYWSLRTRLKIPAGGSVTESAFLLLHEGGPAVAWNAFHEFAHADPHPPIDWLSSVKVHYYDFLSAKSPDGPRGGGYLSDAEHFREFQVGLATQHGYYPFWGDYIHPDRSEWMAMPGDVRGAVPMSFDAMRERISLTRRQGARAAVYIHLAGFDEASPLWGALRDSCRIRRDGTQTPFPWNGPDIRTKAHFLSIADPAWRDHLLQQAHWIFEILNPDAIVVDETFAGMGYDFHPSRAGIVSGAMIDFMKKLRAVARSFGPDKAILTSDCGLASFCLWADGEGGDHAYPGILGHPEYRSGPVRFRAALGNKPWVPCAWLWRSQWENQLDLARKTGAGVGVANGHYDHSGLAHLSPDSRASYLHDIAELTAQPVAAT